jgi:hypothetical protein
MRTKLIVGVAAAALTLTLAGSAAAADPNPPYVRSSQPGGLELYGFHAKQISPTVRCYTGLQRSPQGLYRFWGRCDGDGRRLRATFSKVVFVEARNEWGPATYSTIVDSRVYATGNWHAVQDLALVASKVTVSYRAGASTGAPKCLESYIIRRGQRAAYAAPRSGC